jgi:hypothetical protein
MKVICSRSVDCSSCDVCLDCSKYEGCPHRHPHEQTGVCFEDAYCAKLGSNISACENYFKFIVKEKLKKRVIEK